MLHSPPAPLSTRLRAASVALFREAWRQCLMRGAQTPARYISISSRLSQGAAVAVPLQDSLIPESPLETHTHRTARRECMPDYASAAEPSPGAATNVFRRPQGRSWKHLLKLNNPLVAARELAALRMTNTAAVVPFGVMLRMLERPIRDLRALDIFIREARSYVQAKGAISGIEEAFLLFSRLLRDAREISPLAFEDITELLLHPFPPESDRKNPAWLSTQTYWLNKAMLLLSLPSAVHPFRDTYLREAAVLRILRYMADHDPPLHVNRNGFRAVVRIQLAQPKTGQEQQWAELKMLSWPPWKRERNAMDSNITAEQHGMSRAANTLLRMREAGYSRQLWEDVAGIYAGWNPDGTPTIQTRVLLGVKDEPLWAARIRATRTVQEAWAAYLAYEATEGPRASGVYLAIFEKLHQEGARQQDPSYSRVWDAASDDEHNANLPGDVREISPPPPSAHLYTYTRTPAPTMQTLFWRLWERKITLDEWCFAFLIMRAPSPRDGFTYLRAAQSQFPAIRALSTLDIDADTSEVPGPIFSAMIALLCRFLHTELTVLWTGLAHVPKSATKSALPSTRFNLQHPLVYATLLIARNPLSHPSTFRFVLQALARGNELANLYWNPPAYLKPFQRPQSTGLRSQVNILLAYQLARHLLQLMRRRCISPSGPAFRASCVIVENTIITCWKAFLHYDGRRKEEDISVTRQRLGLLLQANELLHEMFLSNVLRRDFCLYVGQDETDILEAGKSGARSSPRLLCVPYPAVLHVYIRALGWQADYEGLLGLVRWMCEHKDALSETRAQFKSGDKLFRRAIVALRVFLERSWSHHERDALPTDPRVENEFGKQGLPRLDAQLHRLRSPASPEVIAEVKGLIERVHDWHGWPDDDEVLMYSSTERIQEIGQLLKARSR